MNVVLKLLFGGCEGGLEVGLLGGLTITLVQNLKFRQQWKLMMNVQN